MGVDSPHRRLDVVRHAAVSPVQLLDAGLDIAYQPIVHLGSGQVIAYEALTRPRHPAAGNPLAFFRTLEQSGLRLEGERAAFRAAMRCWEWRTGRLKLFVNASPLTLIDGDFDVVELLDIAEAHGLVPSDLVVEVTESEAVDDIDALAFRARKLRRLGISVAVDDAGAGHASFRVITRLRPSYIKLDRDLIAGVDGDGARRAFIEAMVRFARQIGSRLVAEGIETEGELASLAGLGVEAGQGYFLARPRVGAFSKPSDAARRMIAAAAQRLRLGAAEVTIGELALPVTTVDPGATVAEVYTRLCANPSVGLVVCGDGNGHRAQISRRSLERLLATPSAWERLADRPVREVAEHEPVTVVAQLDVAEVAAILATRHTPEVADDVIVTDPRGSIVGTATVRDILRTLADVRDRRAGDLNPLTGLPGAAWLDQELERRLSGGEAVTVVFVDVDDFSNLNHLGGFALGDKIIRVLGRCLTGVAGGVTGAALAHVGGDDFVLLVPPRQHEELVTELVRSVEGDVMPVVRTELRLHDAVEALEHIAVSLGAVDLYGDAPPGHRYLEWAQARLVEPLRTAKAHAGYTSVHHTEGRFTVSTWTPRREGRRVLALGLAEPAVVLGALDLVDQSWRKWWERRAQDGVGGEAFTGFPGPPETVLRLQERYGAPLRARAVEAVASGRPVMEVTLEGDEAELLGLLDRLALVTEEAYDPTKLPVPPEFALLDRLLRQRARAITRRDVVSSTGTSHPGDAHRPRIGASSG